MKDDAMREKYIIEKRGKSSDILANGQMTYQENLLHYARYRPSFQEQIEFNADFYAKSGSNVSSV